ncbi:MAG TPA: cysteine-rich CWC family protein [Candidatus Methylacidiphilales bacterium]|jgi:hypothetical protein|nr:cysteine-rich CWC family protein [Candidatus Methylacidiphilales bacterium]
METETPSLHGRFECCPLCGKDNGCRVAKGCLYKGPCWCHEIKVPAHVLRRLAEEWVEPACLCRPCLETISRISGEHDGTEAILREIRRAIAPADTDLSPEDYYLEEGRYVFTAAYHLKRGFCCDSGCRHCPYPIK